MLPMPLKQKPEERKSAISHYSCIQRLIPFVNYLRYAGLNMHRYRLRGDRITTHTDEPLCSTMDYSLKTKFYRDVASLFTSFVNAADHNNLNLGITKALRLSLSAKHQLIHERCAKPQRLSEDRK